MSPQKTAVCPQCNTPGAEVKTKTIKHWLLTDLVPSLPDMPFYFCGGMACPVVYFSGDGSIRYTKEKVRYPIGIKEGNCACDVRNPKGSCCLAGIKKAEKGH